VPILANDLSNKTVNENKECHKLTNLLKRSRRWVDEGHDRDLGIGGTESLVPDLEIEGTDGTGGGALPDPTRHLPEIAEKTSGANKLNWETNSEDWLMSVLMNQLVVRNENEL